MDLLNSGCPPERSFSPWKKDGELRHRKKVKETVFYEFRKDIAIDLTGFSFLIAQILIQNAIGKSVENKHTDVSVVKG